MLNNLELLTAGVERFYAISDQVPASYILALLWVARNPDGNQIDLEKYLGSSNATASRAVTWWSAIRNASTGECGPDFIENYRDPLDRRFVKLRLTAAGQIFVASLQAAQKEAA